MATIGGAFPKLMPKLHKWAAEHHAIEAGPPLMRFRYIDMDKRLDIEVGFPVAKPVKGDAEVYAGTIPAGEYVSLTHFGNYSGLVPPNAALQSWASEKHLKFKMTKDKMGDEFASRVEIYKTDPDKQPDPAKWETEILYLIER